MDIIKLLAETAATVVSEVESAIESGTKAYSETRAAFEADESRKQKREAMVAEAVKKALGR